MSLKDKYAIVGIGNAPRGPFRIGRRSIFIWRPAPYILWSRISLTYKNAFAMF